MAEAVPLTKQQIASKLVQEIAKKGDEIPEKYLHKDGFPEAIDAPDLWGNDLLIDFSLLSSSSTEIAKLRSALSQWGCFQVINHGLESSFLEELVEIFKQFFALPLEERIKCSGSNNVFEGYGNDSIYGDHKMTASWNDRLFLTLLPEEDRKLQHWPQKPETFREMLEKYWRKIMRMHEGIYKAMARSLNLDECCFLDFQGKKEVIIGKLSFYPRCSNPKQVLGFPPHSDGTMMSIILPERDVEGLQVEKDDLWYKVPTTPGALFVNLGDLAEVMTNGVYKSAMHRVVTSSLKERMSVAIFCHPEKDKEIEPVSGLVSVQQPQMYKKFNIDEFRQIFFKSHALGHRPLDAFKL